MVGIICQLLFKYTIYTRPGVDNTKLLLFERGSIRVKIVLDLLLYLLQLGELVSGSGSLATNRAAIYLGIIITRGTGGFWNHILALSLKRQRANIAHDIMHSFPSCLHESAIELN